MAYSFIEKYSLRYNTDPGRLGLRMNKRKFKVYLEDISTWASLSVHFGGLLPFRKDHLFVCGIHGLKVQEFYGDCDDETGNRK